MKTTRSQFRVSAAVAAANQRRVERLCAWLDKRNADIKEALRYAMRRAVLRAQKRQEERRRKALDLTGC